MLGMKLEDVSEGRDEVKVTTTGAIYVITKSSQGAIQCYQRIGKERLVATITLNTSTEKLALSWTDGESCFAYEPFPDVGLQIRVNSDSAISVYTERGIKKIDYNGAWVPEYKAVERGNFLFLDRDGGFGVYPLRLRGRAIPRANAKFSRKGWHVSLSLMGEDRFMASVCPPRPFDWEKSFGDRIVHHFISHPPSKPWTAYPRNDEVEEYSKYGNILVLHWWAHGLLTKRGKGVQSRDDCIHNACWSSFRHEPMNEAELVRTVRRAHDLGMRVIPYMTSYYFPGEPHEFLKEVDSVVDRYHMDGVYIDGVSNDVLQAYTVMRGLRNLLGDKILYVHVPSPIIGRYDADYVYCPFIETYADYTLKAEHVFKFDWKHLRYTISGRNISNSIGFVCNYDYEPRFTRWLVRNAFKSNTRLPYWVGFDAYVEERQKVFGRKHYPEEESHKIMREEYFPKLDTFQKSQATET